VLDTNELVGYCDKLKYMFVRLDNKSKYGSVLTSEENILYNGLPDSIRSMNSLIIKLRNNYIEEME
jgi:hypothetical protein